MSEGSSKFCRKCGAKIPRDSMFCEECGASLVEGVPPQTQPESSVPRKRWGFRVQNRKWGSLCVSAVMLAALLTGAYSMMVQPTLTNWVTATRTETESSVSPITTEVTSLYVSTSTESTIAGTVTSRFTTCSTPTTCQSGYEFEPGPVTLHWYEMNEEYEVVSEYWETLTNVCISHGGTPYFPLQPGEEPVQAQYPNTVVYCGLAASTVSSYSTRTLTVTSVNTNLSMYYSTVPFPVTLTESYYRNVVNPEKLNLQRLAVVLFVIGLAGIALLIVLRKLVSFPRKEISV
jgi:hypothetical protein